MHRLNTLFFLLQFIIYFISLFFNICFILSTIFICYYSIQFIYNLCVMLIYLYLLLLYLYLLSTKLIYCSYVQLYTTFDTLHLFLIHVFNSLLIYTPYLFFILISYLSIIHILAF